MYRFSTEEVNALNDAQLILKGIPPSEINQMSPEQMVLVLGVAKANERLQAERMQRLMGK
ncbi:MAG: hypothetical protein ACPG7F_00005 [Aggregatilineales bacterium]